MPENSNYVSFRLSEERKRVGGNQDHWADELSVHLKTYQRWESKVPIPSNKLEVLATHGFDVQYIITGVHSDDASAIVAEATAPVIERLRQVMEAEHLKARELAVEIGEKPVRIEQILKGERHLGVDVLLKLGEKINIDGNWLLRGEGLMYHRPPELMHPISEKDMAWIDTFRQLPTGVFANLLAIAEAWLKR